MLAVDVSGNVLVGMTDDTRQEAQCECYRHRRDSTADIEGVADRFRTGARVGYCQKKSSISVFVSDWARRESDLHGHDVDAVRSVSFELAGGFLVGEWVMVKERSLATGDHTQPDNLVH